MALADEDMALQSMGGVSFFFFLIVKGIWKQKGKFDLSGQESLCKTFYSVVSKEGKNSKDTICNPQMWMFTK